MIEKLDEQIKIFKPYLKVDLEYKGGKTLAEIRSEYDGKVFKMSSNENMLGPSPKAILAVNKHVSQLNFYPERTDMKLRENLASYYDFQLPMDSFMASPSGSEVIEILIRAFLGPGLECIVSNPAFMPYIMFSKRQGAKVIDIRLEGDDFKLNVDGILSAINENTRLVFLTSPNNPTGTIIPKHDMDRIINSVPEHVIVVVDEVYHHFVDSPDYVSALPYVMLGKNVVGINSFSKAYGLAGMRAGYAYSTPEIIRYIRNLYKPFMVGTLAMEAAIAALNDTEFITKTIKMVRDGKSYLYYQLDQLPIKYTKSQGNFILLWPDMPEKEFETKMLGHGIMVRPVAGFGAPGGVRVTIGTAEANLAFITALKSVLSRA